jgi:hypothetical protein
MQVLKWRDESAHRHVCLRLLPDLSKGHEDWGWQWTGAVSVETVGYSPLKVRAKKRREGGDLMATNIMIHTALQGPVTVLTIHEQRDNAALEVHNRSSLLTACFRQAKVSQEFEEKAGAGAVVAYCWDHPHAPPVLHMRYEAQGQQVAAREYNMDRLGAFPPLVFSMPGGGGGAQQSHVQHAVLVAVIARGPTKVLLIEDALPGSDNECSPAATTAQAAPSSHDSRHSGCHPAGDNRPAPRATGSAPPQMPRSVCYTAALAGVGVSIIDATPEELIYLSAMRIQAKLVRTKAWELVHLSLGNLQVDNQTSIGAPVLIGPDMAAARPPDRRSGGSAGAHSPNPGAAGSPDTVSPLHSSALLRSSDKFQSRHDSPPSSPDRPGSGRARGGADGGPDSTAAGHGAGGGLHPSEAFLSVKVSKMLGEATLDCYDSIDVSLADTFVDVDESLLVRLLGAFSGILSSLNAMAEGEAEAEDEFDHELPLKAGSIGALDLSLTNANRAASERKWTYIETLRIRTLRLYITFSSSDDAHGLLQRLGPLSNLPIFAFVEAFKAAVRCAKGALSGPYKCPMILSRDSY